MIDRSQQPLIHNLEEFRLKAPQRYVLPNGVNLWVLDSGDVEVTRIDLVINAGRHHQSQLLQALFTNRMLREGTTKLNRSQIAEQLDFHGAWMDQNISFEHSYITLFTLNKHLSTTIALLAQMVKEPIFDAQVLEVVKQNNLQRFLTALQQPNAQARRLFKRAIYGQHLLSHMADASDYKVVNTEMLKEFHQQWYHSGNLSIYLAGRITDECIEIISQTFGEPFGKGQKGGEFYQENIPQQCHQQLFKEMPDTAQSSVLVGKSTINQLHPDFLPLRVLVTLLGGYFGSRLMTTIREEKGLTYSIYSVLNPSPYDNAFMILSDCDHSFVKPLLAETYHQIERLQNELVGDDELTMVRNSMKGDLLRNYDSCLSISDAWILMHTLGLPNDYFYRFWQAITTVTPTELQRLACTYLTKDTLTEIVTGEKMS